MTQTAETPSTIECPDCGEALQVRLRQTVTKLPDGGSVIEMHDMVVEHHCPVTGNEALSVRFRSPMSYCSGGGPASS